MANGRRRRNYNRNPYINTFQDRLFEVSPNNPYAYQNQFVGDALYKGAEETQIRKEEELARLEEERRLREESLKDISRTYIDQFPPGVDVSDASAELGDSIMAKMTDLRNKYGKLAIGYPKAEIGSEQAGIIKAGMDDIMNQANSLNNQVTAWTEMKQIILEKAASGDYENQFSKDDRNTRRAQELLKVFTGEEGFAKPEIRDGKIGYVSAEQGGKFVTIKEMQRNLPFGKATGYAENFNSMRNKVLSGQITAETLPTYTSVLRTNLEGEEGLQTALSLATDDVILPGITLMSETTEDEQGNISEAGFVFDYNQDGDTDDEGERNVSIGGFVTQTELLNAVYSGNEEAKKLLKDEIYKRLNAVLENDAKNIKTKTDGKKGTGGTDVLYSKYKNIPGAVDPQDYFMKTTTKQKDGTVIPKYHPLAVTDQKLINDAIKLKQPVPFKKLADLDDQDIAFIQNSLNTAGLEAGLDYELTIIKPGVDSNYQYSGDSRYQIKILKPVYSIDKQANEVPQGTVDQVQKPYVGYNTTQLMQQLATIYGLSFGLDKSSQPVI